MYLFCKFTVILSYLCSKRWGRRGASQWPGSPGKLPLHRWCLQGQGTLSLWGARRILARCCWWKCPPGCRKCTGWLWKWGNKKQEQSKRQFYVKLCCYRVPNPIRAHILESGTLVKFMEQQWWFTQPLSDTAPALDLRRILKQHFN